MSEVTISKALLRKTPYHYMAEKVAAADRVYVLEGEIDGNAYLQFLKSIAKRAGNIVPEPVQLDFIAI